jgi:hypothetical protein
LLNTTPNTGAVRAGDGKLVVHTSADIPDGGPAQAGGKKSVELFHLKDDPYEKTNRAAKNPEKARELQAALAGFAKQAVPTKAKPKPNDFFCPKVWGEKDRGNAPPR